MLYTKYGDGYIGICQACNKPFGTPSRYSVEVLKQVFASDYVCNRCKAIGVDEVIDKVKSRYDKDYLTKKKEKYYQCIAADLKETRSIEETAKNCEIDEKKVKTYMRLLGYRRKDKYYIKGKDKIFVGRIKKKKRNIDIEEIEKNFIETRNEQQVCLNFLITHKEFVSVIRKLGWQLAYSKRVWRKGYNKIKVVRRKDLNVDIIIDIIRETKSVGFAAEYIGTTKQILNIILELSGWNYTGEKVLEKKGEDSILLL